MFTHYVADSDASGVEQILPHMMPAAARSVRSAPPDDTSSIDNMRARSVYASFSFLFLPSTPPPPPTTRLTLDSAARLIETRSALMTLDDDG